MHSCAGRRLEMARTSAEERIQLEERLRTNLKKFFLSNVAVNRLPYQDSILAAQGAG